MSDHITLRPRSLPDEPIELDCIRPDLFATLDERQIASLPLWIGGESRMLGDLFEVDGGRCANVRIVGDAPQADALGSGMTAGELVIEGSVGAHLGRAMSGGSIHVLGNAGDAPGSALPGASRGMNGGEIVIDGSAGADAGARARRGLVAIGGNAGPGAGRGMIAGTVLIGGSAGDGAGLWSKRGTLIVMGDVTIPATYIYACTYRPTFVAVLLRSLRNRYSLPMPDGWPAEEYRRYSGDLAELGKGEILHRMSQ
jgi:formylmethanofuran dehydrogenase subunit C